MRKHTNSDFHRHTKYQDAKTIEELRFYINFWNNDPVKITCLNKYLNEYDLKLINIDTVGIIHLGIASKSS